MSMQNTIQLQSDHWQLWLDPGKGLGTLAARARHGGEWLDVMPDCRAGDYSLNEANFHMLPYSNRIREGRFEFERHQYQLDHGDVHARHGALRKLPWRVLEDSRSMLLGEFDSRVDGAINWPWPIAAQVRYQLEGRLLQSSMSLTNHGELAMPAGMGWHPYFVRQIGGADAVLTLPVHSLYPDENGDCLPDGPPVSLPPALDFTEARKLDPAQRIDCCFGGFAGEATIAWPSTGLTLRLRASDNCTHLVLCNPDAPHFAVEPVTHANDAVNLQSHGIDAGLVVLEPGASLLATWQLELG